MKAIAASCCLHDLRLVVAMGLSSVVDGVCVTRNFGGPHGKFSEVAKSDCCQTHSSLRLSSACTASESPKKIIVDLHVDEFNRVIAIAAHFEPRVWAIRT